MAPHEFPEPVRFGDRCTRWDADELAAYDAAKAGREPPPKLDQKAYLTPREVARRYRVSVGTVWRWLLLSRRERAA